MPLSDADVFRDVREPLSPPPPPPDDVTARHVLTGLAPVGTVMALFWVWIGRTMVIGEGGWMTLVLVMKFWFVPLLAFVPDIGRLVRSGVSRIPWPMSVFEMAAQVTMWVGLFIVGLAIPEVGDMPGSGGSVLSLVLGTAPGDPLEAGVARFGGVTAALAWLCLLALVPVPHSRHTTRRH